MSLYGYLEFGNNFLGTQYGVQIDHSKTNQLVLKPLEFDYIQSYWLFYNVYLQ